ncbi:MAG: hypothetical protein COB36_05515 [Alphaproteobacteria bacterium]|nr:MAG: hypothetical protein COB36_05515 [Alphaproteobacteria bacterium]
MTNFEDGAFASTKICFNDSVSPETQEAIQRALKKELRSNLIQVDSAINNALASSNTGSTFLELKVTSLPADALKAIREKSSATLGLKSESPSIPTPPIDANQHIKEQFKISFEQSAETYLFLKVDELLKGINKHLTLNEDAQVMHKTDQYNNIEVSMA